MNVERFHAIVNALQGEVEEISSMGVLDGLVAALRGIQDPNQPDAQQQASTARVNVIAALREARSNEFSPGWRQALEELGVADLVGNALADRLEAILSRNEITPSAAADEIAKIQERYQDFYSGLQQASAGLEFFEVGAEELEPGEFEIGFLIPREAVDEDLAELGREFVRLKKIIAPISELAGEGRPDLQVRSISSSGFEVFIHSAPMTALLFAKALDLLLGSYQKYVDIRLKRRELAETDEVPDEYLKGLSDYASGMMEAKIGEIVEKAIAEAKLDNADRLNELRTELRLQFNALAERIDRGYNAEVRAGELPEPPDEEDEEVPGVDLDDETREAAEFVLAKQKELQFMNVSGTPILHLEQPEDPTAEDQDDEPAAGAQPT